MIGHEDQRIGPLTQGWVDIFYNKNWFLDSTVFCITGPVVTIHFDSLKHPLSSRRETVTLTIQYTKLLNSCIWVDIWMRCVWAARKCAVQANSRTNYNYSNGNCVLILCISVFVYCIMSWMHIWRLKVGISKLDYVSPISCCVFVVEMNWENRRWAVRKIKVEHFHQ